MTIADVVAKGDRRKSLEALRDSLAASMDNESDARVSVQIAKELRAVIAELDSLPAREGVSDVDEVARKRAQRRSRAAVKGKA